jgi:hypothetical protein
MTARVPVAVLLDAADVLRSVAHDLGDARGWTYQRDALDTVATALQRAAVEGQDDDVRQSVCGDRRVGPRP